MSKTVLITGTDRGLGASLARVFFDNGYTVFAGVLKHNECHESDTCEREGLHRVELDVSAMPSIQTAVSIVREHTPSLDIIINNAAIIPRDEITGVKKTIFDPLDFDAITQAIDVNALGALRVANAFAELLRQGTEKLLVNISSEAGSIGDCYRDEWFGYCMSKAALNMAGALIHNELRKIGGQVFQIHPGWMQTFMSGEKNEEASYTPDFSAKHIFSLLQNMEQYRADKAVFMDLFGNMMNW